MKPGQCYETEVYILFGDWVCLAFESIQNIGVRNEPFSQDKIKDLGKNPFRTLESEMSLLARIKSKNKIESFLNKGISQEHFSLNKIKE